MSKLQTKALFRVALVIFGLLVCLAGAARFGQYAVNVQAQTELKGEWTAEYDRTKPSEIYFTLQRRTDGDGFNMTSHNVPLSELQGLSAAALSSAKTDVNFNIVREAGTFHCEGFFSNGKGAGFWTLTPSEKFISAMRARGYDNLSSEDLLRAAFNNLTIGYIDELKNAGYDRVTYNELMRARNHDINAEYIREVKDMGFTSQPLETLIRMRNHDINAEFINEMKSAGFENLSIEELIRLKNHDITSSFVNDIRAEGYADVSAETAIRLKNHNVDRDFIRRAKAQGYSNTSLEELVRLSNRGLVK